MQVCFRGAFAQQLRADAPATKPAEVKLVLVTEHYQVTITRSGQEGVVEDNAITFQAVSRKTGESIALKGSTWHTRGPDGTPARFLGYVFRNGNLTYRVQEDGRLKVIRGNNEVLLDESGKWDKQKPTPNEPAPA